MIDCEHDERWRDGYTKFKRLGITGEIAYQLGLLQGSDVEIDQYTISRAMDIINMIDKEIRAGRI